MAKVLPLPVQNIKELEEDKAERCRRGFLRRVHALPWPAFLRDRVMDDGRSAMELWRQTVRDRLGEGPRQP